MKVKLVYATLSGSTMTAAQVVADALTAGGHEVEMLSADGATADTVKAGDAVVLGSPSWEDEGKDGQPLPDMSRFIKGLPQDVFSGKKVAVFGLGDSSYPHFCGAVDVMTELLKGMGVTLVTEPVRVDRYYSVPDNETKVKTWADTLSKTLSS